jgi:hypothetical protein
VVEEVKEDNRKSEFGADWSPRDKANVHERDVGILITSLPHSYSWKATSWNLISDRTPRLNCPNLRGLGQVLTKFCQIRSRDGRWHGWTSIRDMDQREVARQHSTLSLQRGGVRVVNGVSKRLFFCRQKPYGAIRDT